MESDCRRTNSVETFCQFRSCCYSVRCLVERYGLLPCERPRIIQGEPPMSSVSVYRWVPGLIRVFIHNSPSERHVSRMPLPYTVPLGENAMHDVDRPNICGGLATWSRTLTCRESCERARTATLLSYVCLQGQLATGPPSKSPNKHKSYLRGIAHVRYGLEISRTARRPFRSTAARNRRQSTNR